MRVKIIGAVALVAAVVGAALPMHGSGKAEASGQFETAPGTWYTTVNGQNFNVLQLWRR